MFVRPDRRGQRVGERLLQALEAEQGRQGLSLSLLETGGVAVMELIARELKAMGLYIARSLSLASTLPALSASMTSDPIAAGTAGAAIARSALAKPVSKAKRVSKSRRNRPSKRPEPRLLRPVP